MKDCCLSQDTFAFLLRLNQYKGILLFFARCSLDRHADRTDEDYYTTMNETAINEGNLHSLSSDLIIKRLYRWGLLPLFILGFFGNLMTSFFLRLEQFRTHSYCYYLYGSTMSNIILMIFSLLRRLLILGFAVDTWEARILWWCRLRFFIVQVAYFVSAYLMVFSSLDRYLSSFRQLKYRKWCTMLVARRITIGLVVAMLFLNSHVLVWFEIRTTECYAQGVYRLFLEISFTVFQNLFLILGMCTLGLLVCRKARQHLRRNQHMDAHARHLHQFRRLICLQTIWVCILILPRAGQKFYLAIKFYRYGVTQNINTFAMEREEYFIAVFTLMEFTNWSLSFIFYSLASPIFRRQLVRILITVIRGFSSHRPVIAQPLAVVSSEQKPH